jgi:hypothetical protein
MSNRKIEEILADYQKTSKIANTDIDSIPLKSQPGWQTLIRQNKDRVPELRVEYLTALLGSSYGFFLDGDPKKVTEFVAVTKESGAFVIDAAKIFNKLADAVQPSLGGRREFSVTQLGQLNYALKELAQETGYGGEIYGATMTEIKVVPTRDDLVTYVRRLVVGSNGSTISVISAQNNLVADALKVEFLGKKLVVMVVGATNDDRQGLASIFTRTERVHLTPETVVDERFAKETVMGVLKPGSRKTAPIEKSEQTQTENQE